MALTCRERHVGEIVVVPYLAATSGISPLTVLTAGSSPDLFLATMIPEYRQWIQDTQDAPSHTATNEPPTARKNEPMHTLHGLSKGSLWHTPPHLCKTFPLISKYVQRLPREQNSPLVLEYLRKLHTTNQNKTIFFPDSLDTGRETEYVLSLALKLHNTRTTLRNKKIRVFLAHTTSAFNPWLHYTPSAPLALLPSLTGNAISLYANTLLKIHSFSP
jgi:hypothetical protein